MYREITSYENTEVTKTELEVFIKQVSDYNNSRRHYDERINLKSDDPEFNELISTDEGIQYYRKINMKKSLAEYLTNSDSTFKITANKYDEKGNIVSIIINEVK